MRCLGLVLAFVLSAAPLHAQWHVDALAGRIRSTLDPAAAPTSNFVIGAGYDDAAGTLQLMGGVPTGSSEPLWGALAGSRRFSTRAGAFRVGVDIAGNFFMLHDRVERSREIPGQGIFDPPQVVREPSQSGSALAAQAMPLIGFETERLQLHARAGASWYNARFGEARSERVVRMAELQALFVPASTFVLAPVLRGFQDTVGTYKYGGVTAIAGTGAVSVWATVGTWLDADSAAAPWAIGARVRVHSNLELNASMRRDGFDPLYLTPPQSSWNLGASIKLGSARAVRAPVPASYEGGRATLSIPVAQVNGQPRIAGDFNQWKPAAMQKSGSKWTYTVTLAPGVYNYAFVDESGKWFVPPDVPGRKDDGFGGHVAVVVVEP